MPGAGSLTPPRLVSRVFARLRPGREELLSGPIRGELLGPEQLAEKARTVARRQRLATRVRGQRPATPLRGRSEAPLLARLTQTRDLLHDAHARLLAGANRDVDVGPAGEWLLDNFHVVKEHIREVRQTLPRGYYRELPELADGPLAGYPRIYELATTLISHTEARVDRGNLSLFVGAFQSVTPLGIGELWAIPAMLRLALIESVRRMTLRTVQRMDELEEADAWAERIAVASEEGGPALGAELDAFVGSPPRLSPVFVSRFLHRLRLTRATHAPLEQIEQWLGDRAFNPEDALSRSTQRLALTQVIVAHSITSLRTIAHLDWQSFVEEQSVMEAVLREDPMGAYPRMTFATRDRYRHVVERIARRTGRNEEDVARSAVELARTASVEEETEGLDSHVGYYLVDEGLPALEAATGYRPEPGEAVRRWVLRHPDAVFFGALTSGVAAALAALLWLAGAEARTAWPVVLAVGFLPAADLAISVVHQLVTALLPPRTLPRLDLRGRRGIPSELRTAVVVPTLFPSVEAVRETLDHLEVQFLANRNANLHFAVLSDFTDAPAETHEGDDAIVAAAVEGVRALNAQYANGGEDAFYLFHRPRRWNAAEGTWMGWERKRGKLAQFNRFLLGEGENAFSVVVGDVEPLRRARYVITLDADTVLPPDAASDLIGTLAHPLNRAAYDPARGRVVRGYGVLQPRVGVSLPSAHRSRFSAIHSGHPGVDPYTTAVSDVYQDLYGEGSFTGKGIYDVHAFEEATHGRFPENTLLSHDLIEGSFARAGLATEITLYDDYPTRYLTYTRRKHRWIRGDWQLLDWLTPRVPGPDGPEPNRLSVLSRWKILDNLRRSTVEISQLLFLLAGWTVLPGSPLRWTALGFGAIAAPWIASLSLAALRPPRDTSWRAYYAAVGRDAVTSARQVALALAFLPHQAWISADAIVRTLWRMFVTGRFLLEWQTASLSEQTASKSAADSWRAMWPAVAAAGGVAVLAGAEAVRNDALWQMALAAGPLLALWTVAPAIAHALSASRIPSPGQLSAAERDEARRLALLHWQYFDRFTDARTQWLVPDNFQEDPDPVVAMRTSPTNIGLQLLAIGSAHDLGFITTDDMIRRIELAFRSLERMRRFRGHFFNWYDLNDLSVLEPAYVSTVDSGNLAGHLIALRHACLGARNGAASTARNGSSSTDTDPEPALRDARLEALADRAYRYVTEMDFRFLFDEERELFPIGYRVDGHSFDPSYYDLLASEARLASFVAIAKNDVPVEHWFRLGRSLTHAPGGTALVSWSGGMFEYLMPSLVMRAFPLTLLDQTYFGAVQRQVAYGVERGVPWGVSESAYNIRDRHLTYQYRGFGVPDLALKRGLGRDLVVAPYASALAIMFDPERALANLAAFEEQGALGPYGFRDAIDYTRPEPGQGFALIGNYMAHHIGMSLVALTNALTDHAWQERFHADPLVRSAALLLHERIPRRLVLHEPQEARPDDGLPDPELESPAVREFDRPDTPRPHIALLGRHPYTLMVSHCGAGYSRYQGLAVTRWRADGTKDSTGQFCYVKDVTRGSAWSTAHQPVCVPADRYRALLATDRATFHRSDGGIETRTEIAVVPEDAAEVRQVTVTNLTKETREIELTSYAEVVLAPPDADRAHPAFANLFVETEWHEWCTAITATRRPRSASEPSLWLVHVVDAGEARVGPASCETDRARFIGRGCDTRAPSSLAHDGPLSGTTGAVLDPILSIRSRVRLDPGQSASVAFTTLVATTREEAFELADRYHDSHAARRALDLAWTSQQVELRELGLTPVEATTFQELAGYFLYPDPALRAPEEELDRNRGSQPLLWEVGVSGDWPIVLATIDSAAGLPTLRQLLAAHYYWRRRGMTVDLVIINSQAASYLQELHGRILDAMVAARDTETDRPGGVFIRRADQMGADALLMLRGTARLIVPCDGSSLGRLLEGVGAVQEARSSDEGSPPPLPRRLERGPPGSVSTNGGARPQPVDRASDRPGGPGAAAPPPVPLPSNPSLASGPSGPAPARARAETGLPSDETGLPSEETGLLFENGLGGLNAAGEYQIRVGDGRVPPAPWANVVANPLGGFVVSERGSGFTWAGNSYFFRLTPWHNDPVSDPATEVLYLQDQETGALWSATPAPAGGDTPCTVRHRPGSSVFESERDGIETRLSLAMADGEAVKLSELRLTNHDTRPRRLTLTAYVEWTLGVQREHTQHQVRTSYEPELGAALARNSFHPEFADWVAFCALSEPVTAHTADRREFLGRNGTLESPAALRTGSLSGTTGVGVDPCAVLQCVLELAPGESRELVWMLGGAESEADARRTMARLREPGAAGASSGRSVERWSERLSVVRVRTPEPSFDAMINHWTLYQALSCRMWARSALYQSSGAYGFRDQLQDVLAFLYAEPGLAREHIVRAAARQFEEGDVQHWWHPQSGRGVRTRFSDDLIWLPYVVDRYVRVTGDGAVLDESVPFLSMRALEPDEHEVYDLPRIADERATVYEHCLRALRRGCTTGEHGLPLIGSGDWNDGMNRVGIGGRGESVWLGWFLTSTLRSFAEHAEERGDGAVANDLRARADGYRAAVEAHGWDGDWYRRAYFDDGTPLGSSASEECRIDSIAQSWSVISGAGSPERQDRAMRSFEEHLVRPDACLLMLLTPPFDRTSHDPGYIKGYLPGVRENGAQYTHAALWAVLATALRGDGDRAFELYQMLNPLTHTDTPEGVARYKVEPYVVAADVYTAPGQVGRGGWTWYTGSASWMYRVGLEAILGFTKVGDTLRIEPRVPEGWPEFSIEYRFGEALYRITVRAPGAVRIRGAAVSLDGRTLEDGTIPLIDDGTRHQVLVEPRTPRRE